LTISEIYLLFDEIGARQVERNPGRSLLETFRTLRGFDPKVGP
jgi:hypothetical protein